MVSTEEEKKPDTKNRFTIYHALFSTLADANRDRFDQMCKMVDFIVYRAKCSIKIIGFSWQTIFTDLIAFEKGIRKIIIKLERSIESFI